MIKTGLKFMALMTLITGFIYPMIITAVAQIVFPHQANGSLIEANGKVIGSEWIGQDFHASKDFWGRPSATQPFPYHAASSAGSNLGPSNPALIELVQQRVTSLRQAHPQNNDPIPVDLITASASGLDPHISPEAAEFQVTRVAHANQLPEQDIQALVDAHIEHRTLNILGEPRVNVLKLNLALEQLRSPHAGSTSESH